MSTDKATAGPLEALLLAIALVERGAEPVIRNEEDGPEIYILAARDWLGIVECASYIATPIVLARADNATRYVVEVEHTAPGRRFQSEGDER